MNIRASYFLLLLAGGFAFSSCATPGPRSKIWAQVSQKIGPAEYIPLHKACELLKMNYEWDALTQKHILYKSGSYLSFKANDPFVSVNGRIRRLSYPPRLFQGNLMLPRELAGMRWWRKAELSWPEVEGLNLDAAFLIDKVVIDAGHGGRDRGAVGSYGIIEKDVVLEIAKKLRQELEVLGIQVVMTREDDTFLTLPERAWIANNSGADLFISIHANSAPDRRVSGTEIYHLTEGIDDHERARHMVFDYARQVELNPDLPNGKTRDPTVWDMINTENRQESIELARAVHSSLKRHGSIKNRGIKNAEFFVLKWTDKPAILVETGFLTHRQEARRLISPSYQEHLASLIAEGLMAYKAEYERTKGFTA